MTTSSTADELPGSSVRPRRADEMEMAENTEIQPTGPNRMLGSQLLAKSYAPRSPRANGKQQVINSNSKQTEATKQMQPAKHIYEKSPGQTPRSPPKAANEAKCEQQTSPPSQIPMSSKKSLELKQCKTTAQTSVVIDETDHQDDTQRQQQVATTAGQTSSSSAKEMQLLAKEAQDLKTKSRKLQLEVDEKNEIINVLKDELETLREQNDKYHRDSIQLIKDSKRVQFLQDENDFLQDKVGQVEVLELEIKRLKERLNETDFFKLRVQELEEDLAKARDESNQFEDKWQQAEGKLTRVPDLESELNKWKSFSHELELEKSSIQAKLMELIDNETRLSSDNKKVEHEVRRLRDLVKSYEEQRDEEQASNSLIMTVADLKLLDDQRQQVSKNLSAETATSTSELFCVQDMGQQTESSDTADMACETDHVDIVDPNQHQQRQQGVVEQHLQTLKDEKATLKEEVDRQELKLGELAESNKRILKELNSNRTLISDLRQDLACEKSLTQKLTTQLTSFTKQIKSMDKQYFPMNDTAAQTATDRVSNRLEATREVDCKKLAAKTSDKKTSGTDFRAAAQKISEGGQSGVVALSDDLDNGSKASSTPVDNVLNGDSPAERKGAEVIAGSKLTTLNNNYVIKDVPGRELDEYDHDADDEHRDSIVDCKSSPKATPTNASQPGRASKINGNFVRNSLPSKSVNFGHSKSSPYLDRIRASVTATAVTSSSNTSAASFNGQTTNTVGVSPMNQQILASDIRQQQFVLNCMLNHVHTDRCYAKIARPTRVQVSQPTLAHALHINPATHRDETQTNHNQAHNHQTSSRQLNALIDPVPNEQLFMNMMQQQLIAQQQQSGLPTVQQMSEQQVAHLSNLQRQHYYHHLHQLHQMHHLHQLHHLHHKCQQQQQQQQQRSHHPQPPPQPKPEPFPNMVGSQFYAPNYDAVYANMAKNNITNSRSAEFEVQKQVPTRLIGDKIGAEDGFEQPQQQQQTDHKRISPQRNVPLNSSYGNQQISGGTKLAQIDELTSNLPANFNAPPGARGANENQARRQHYSEPPETRAVSQMNGRIGRASSQQREKHSSPTMSSPTSSRTSSNTSPSSEASSSSSVSSANSLSNSVPLTRSALRHTATEISRRQYSVERELINSTPLTATLSRVGSCRGAPPSNQHHHHHHLNGQQLRETPASRDINSLMRNPVQSQQLPTRTSKILTTGSQQQQQQLAGSGATSNGNLIDSGKLAFSKEVERPANYSDGGSSLASNGSNKLANIRLNNSMAFSSLRIPKKSSSGSNLTASLISATNGGSISAKNSSTSSSPDKTRPLRNASRGSPVGRPSGGSGGANSNGHPPVWYEYGCI